MTMAADVAAAYVDSIVSADATLLAVPGWSGVEAGIATANPDPAAVWGKWQVTAGPDATYASGIRYFWRGLIQLGATGRAENYANVSAAANRLDELFKRITLATFAGATSISVYRDPAYGERVDYTLEDGIRYVSIYGFYRFLVRQ